MGERKPKPQKDAALGARTHYAADTRRLALAFKSGQVWYLDRCSSPELILEKASVAMVKDIATDSPWHNGDRSFLAADVRQVLDKLNMAEKIALLAGADWWHTEPVHRLSYPAS